MRLRKKQISRIRINGKHPKSVLELTGMPNRNGIPILQKMWSTCAESVIWLWKLREEDLL